jgi:hypothetical protein
MSALHALRAMIRNILPGLLLTGLACAQPADPLPAGGITLTDDIGRTVRLEAPARRIVSLAPHITEILYAAGAGEYLVGAVEFSDYPEAARALPRVGSYAKYDLEAIAAPQTRSHRRLGKQPGRPPHHTSQGLAHPAVRQQTPPAR